MLAQYFEAMGHGDEFIEETLNDYEDNGKLYNRALAAQEELAIAQEQQREEM